jgi:hypothetical protein
MKKISLIFLLFPLICFSQNSIKKEIAVNELDSIIYTLSSKTMAPSDIRLPFSRIEIADARFDTSKLGFEIHKKYDKITSKDFKKIKLEGGIQNAIQDFYNDYYKLSFNDTANSLLIVLKTLWIDNVPDPGFKEKRRYEIVKESYQNIYVKFEFYLKKLNAYYPLKRTDTVYQLTESIYHSGEINFKRNDLSFFNIVLKSMVEKFDFNQMIRSANYNRALTLVTIDSFNKKRFLIPILTDSIISKGVFLNFNDFSTNTPIKNEYKFKKNKGKELLFMNKDTLNNHFYLSVSDDAGLHFSSLKKNEMIRVGNTFEFFGVGTLYSPKTVAGNLLRMIPERVLSSPVNDENIIYSGDGTKLQIFWVPRQFNMETGEIY